MINDAQQRADELTHAYATLYAEFLTLQTAQMNDCQPQRAPPIEGLGLAIPYPENHED